MFNEIRTGVILPAIFSDHMVLQHGRPLPIWGRAAPGERITVAFGDVRAESVADGDGKWLVTLPELAIDGVGGELSVTGESAITLRDVVVGEVWLCSGQSNMEFGVDNVRDADVEIAAATQPQIRHFQVQRNIAESPADSVPGEWQVCSPETVGKFTAVGYFFARNIRATLDVPVGLIHSSWGGTPIEAWMSEAKVKSDSALGTVLDRRRKLIRDYPAAKDKFDEELAAWEREAAAAKSEGKPFDVRRPRDPVGPGHPYMPITLYNGMIHPLVPFAMRGVLWYQGEANAGTTSQTNEYQKLFPALISQWRDEWGQGDFPFYYVQLANFRACEEQSLQGTSWAFLREAQTMALSTPNTGMAVAIDIGNPDDVHPNNKQEVGRRLALIALAKTYGRPDVVYSGPTYKFAVRDGNGWLIHFDHADGLIATGPKPTGFQIAGSDENFVEATAVLLSNGVVRVHADSVRDPQWVRYAWLNSPEANVYNAAGLPMVPFRTDTGPRP